MTSLLQRLKAQLAKQQEMLFVDFMQQALYAPGLGYYSSNLTKLGRQGDFITAPELSPLFGQALANQCQQIMANLDSPVLFEYGAGTGRLCVEILRHLESIHSLPKHYFIMEVSSNLRHRQKELIHQEIPHLAPLVIWLDRLPTEPFNGIILANEVLDAMPVHRFMMSKQGILESYIKLNEKEELIEFFKPSTNKALVTYVEEKLSLQAPYLSEVNLFVEDWVLNNYKLLTKGAMILIDYGFPRQEYYHPDRVSGTIMCHYQQKAHTNFLQHLGMQDITAHVDFTQVAESGQKAGFHIAGFTNQAAFLLGNGLLDLLNKICEKERFYANQAVKMLTSPAEMGELFKVMALTKDCDMDLTGFQLLDKRVSL